MTAGPLEFPAGSMLTVLRAGALDPFGDPVGSGFEPVHDVGPCSIVREKTGRKTDTQQDREVRQVKVRCQQVDADVRKADRIRLPNGRVVRIVSAPYRPTNSFTGWQPSLRFTLEEVS